jgi:hypothetical protein
MTALQALDDWLAFKQKVSIPHSEYVYGVVRGQVKELLTLEQRSIEQAYVAGATSKETPEQYYVRMYGNEEN